jgi:putative ABC transport system permease protein
MIIKHIYLAFRRFYRNRFFTIINLIGLSSGLAVFFMLWPYSQNELRSDRFHKDSEHIVRFAFDVSWTDNKKDWEQFKAALSSMYFSNKIREEYSEIKDMCRIYDMTDPYLQDSILGHGKEILFSIQEMELIQKEFVEDDVIYADTNLFEFFTIPLIYGNKNNVLDHGGSVVISESIYIKYFGDENPIGKMIVLNDSIPLTVTGVFRDLPQNTHLTFNIVISMKRISQLMDNGIIPCLGVTYYKLNPDIQYNTLSEKINKERKSEIEYAAWGGWPHGRANIYFQPLHEMAFENHRWDRYQEKSRLTLLILAVTSLVILFIAWINYSSLSVEQYRKRMKEFLVRNVVGAGYSDFITMFIVESFLLNIIALLFAITVLQVFRGTLEQNLNFYLLDWLELPVSTYVVMGSVVLFGIVGTGIYPVMIILKKYPLNIHDRKFIGRDKYSISGFLTVFQFSCAIVLLVWIYLVNRQLKFILDKDIGYDYEEVMVVDLPVIKGKDIDLKIEYFARQAMKIPEIRSYSVSQSVAGDNDQQFIALKRNESDPGIQVETNGGVDHNFIPFYNIKLISGRNFLPDSPADFNSIILSESTVQRLGFVNPEDAIGRNLYYSQKIEIIGIIKDYKLRPLLTTGYLNYGGNPGIALTYMNHLFPNLKSEKISFKIETTNFQQTISSLDKIYNQVFEGDLFNWYFLNDIINSKYQKQLTSRNQIFLFSLIALGIALIGLLASISYKIVEKTKEIGIRKILGAHMKDIGMSLIRPTFYQIMISMLLSIPVAWYLGRQYLEYFTEQITLQWWYFLVPVFILLFILTSTVMIILLKASRINPAEELRYE